jgi:Flp pilus assembly protein TadD
MEQDPTNPLRHDIVGMLHLDGGEYEQAIAHFRESLRLNPLSAPTHYNLGVALSAVRRGPEAATEFAETVRLDPANADAHNNLGALLHALGRFDEARAEYERAIALRPNNVEAHNNLGRLLILQGDTAAAIREFRQALELRPDWPDALTGLAWAIATTADPMLMNGAEAVKLAERAAALTDRKNVLAMDALGAAYAAAGRYDEALAAADQAISLAAGAGATQLVLEIRARRDLYERRTPFHVAP